MTPTPAVLDSRPDVGRTSRHHRGAPVVRDLLVAGAVVVGLWLTVSPETGRPVQGGLALVGVLAVALRHRFPVPAAVVAAMATAVAWILGATADPCILVGLCLFTVAERRGRELFPGWSVAVAAVAGLLLLTGANERFAEGIRWLVVALVVVTASWALGTRARQVRAEAALRAAVDERLRLSREVHDVLSHSLGTIGVRAGVAAHVTGLGPDALRETLREIESDARGSLVRLRGLLDLARADGAGVEAPEAEPTVHGGLADGLCELAREVQRCGIHAEVDVAEMPRPLPLALRTTIFRIAQEATTNVVRHSGATQCRISLSSDATAGHPEVVLAVVDDGRGAGGGPAAGHGMTGMHERAALLGGTLKVDDGSGFTVTARLPHVPDPQDGPA